VIVKEMEKEIESLEKISFLLIVCSQVQYILLENRNTTGLQRDTHTNICHALF
jgi:hypothetical protein